MLLAHQDNQCRQFKRTPPLSLLVSGLFMGFLYFQRESSVRTRRTHITSKVVRSISEASSHVFSVGKSQGLAYLLLTTILYLFSISRAVRACDQQGATLSTVINVLRLYNRKNARQLN